MILLNRIDFPCKFESVAEPFINYNDEGLDVYFLAYKGDGERENIINNYITLHKLENEMAIPDDVYNNAGYTIAHVVFQIFNSFTLLSRDIWLKNIVLQEELTVGIYEESHQQTGNTIKYHFLGHDTALTVAASSYSNMYFSDL